MAAIERDGLTIYIVDVGTAASDLASSDKYIGSITNYAQSGGTQEFETTNTFGGDIQRTLPRDEFEFTIEVTPAYDELVDNYASLFMGEDGTNSDVYTSAQQAPRKQIYVEATDGSNTFTHAFNNGRFIDYEPDHSADDTLTLSMTYNTPALTEDGQPNHMVEKTAATGVTDWSSLNSV